MAINSCSINAHTINSLLCRRKNIVPGPISEAGGSVQQYRYQNWYGRPDEEVDVDLSKLENTNISITISMNGKEYQKTFENIPDPMIPMIAVTDIKVNNKMPNITISNLTFYKR